MTSDGSSDLSTGEALAVREPAARSSGPCWGIRLLLVTGMVAHVVAAAAVGRRLSLGEAWAATRGSRWRLVGLALLLGLMAFGMLAVYVALWVVVVLVAPTVVIVLFGLVTVPAFIACCSGGGSGLPARAGLMMIGGPASWRRSGAASDSPGTSSGAPSASAC